MTWHVWRRTEGGRREYVVGTTPGYALAYGPRADAMTWPDERSARAFVRPHGGDGDRHQFAERVDAGRSAGGWSGT